MKQLSCADAGFECDAVFQGESTEAVLEQAGPHAQEVHDLEVTPELAEVLSGKIREV